MRKFVIAALCGSVAGALVATQLAGPLLAEEAKPETSVYEQLDLFGDIFSRIRAQYVEEVDSQKLIEAAINGMLTSLDPHSSYMPPEDFDDMQVQTRGEFGGLGIEVTQEEGYRPVMVGLQYFFQLNVAWGEVMAYLSLITVPVLAFYLYLQKAFIASIASTGVKG